MSGARVASGLFAHCGGMLAGTSGIGVSVDVDVDVGVRVNVAVGRGVAVGATIICVTKLQANNDNIKAPKAIRFVFMVYL